MTETEQIVNQCRAEYKAGLDFRHAREQDWKLAEDQYFNRQAKSLKQRYNVPVPIVPGFVETLLSKVDDPPAIKAKQGDEADYKAVQKVNAFIRIESKAEDYDWDMLDLDAKKEAILYGRAIAKVYSQSKPEYKSNLEDVDVYDFIADPKGGGNLEKHLFAQQDNLFKNKQDLKLGVESMGYDARAVEKIINATSGDKLVDNDNQYRSKQSRLMALGLDGITFNYAGQPLYKFIEAGTTFNGHRYYVLFNNETGVAVKCVPLKEVFKSNLWPWVSWATHRDLFNFWSKAPVDDIVPLAEMIRVLVNQELDNRQKRNWGQRAYDPDVYPNPSDLNFRPDGLVATKSGASRLQPIGNGVYMFETPELNGSIDLVNWIDGIIGEKTGVNADAQGSSQESRVGVYYGNLQQIADRLGLYNKSYKKFWAAIGRRYIWGLFEHLRAPIAVEIIGEKGAEWDEIKRTEINPKWNILVEGGNAEMAEDEAKKQRLVEVMGTLQPDELMILSPRWRAETKLRSIGLEEDEIRMAFDIDSDGNREILAEASQMIQDCLAGKDYKLNTGANTAFVQKILDFATDADDLKPGEYEKLMQIVEVHIPIAEENMARKAVAMMAQRGTMPGPEAQAAPTEELATMDQPAPGTPSGTASISQQISNQLTANA
jgi:hypothetical protein